MRNLDYNDVKAITTKLVNAMSVNGGIDTSRAMRDVAQILSSHLGIVPTHSYSVEFEFKTLDDGQAASYRINALLQKLPESLNESIENVTITPKLL